MHAISQIVKLKAVSWQNGGREMNRLTMMVAAMAAWSAVAEPKCVSGVYPSLAYCNEEGECGTGAVVPWVGSLWVITY